jgi:hypothetical protein
MATALSSPVGRGWTFPRLPLRDWVVLTLGSWTAMLAGVVTTGNVIDHWKPIAALFGFTVGEVAVTQSIWAPMMTNVAVWFVAVAGGYYVYAVLPATVAAGRTRRDAAIEVGLFTGTMVILVSTLAVAGYAVERGIYALSGWQRGTPEIGFLPSYDVYGWLAIACLLGFGIWGAAGAAIGSGFYHSANRGAAAILATLATALITGAGLGSAAPFGFILRLFDINADRTTIPALSITGIASLVGIFWGNVRNVSLHNA